MRNTGEKIDGKTVKALRERRGWTQEELAKAMGLRGGKGVISAWESDKTSCEGPAAELLLRLLGAVDTDAEYEALQHAMGDVWARARSGSIKTWRQFSAVALEPPATDESDFMSLFPAAAIPGDEYAHGFPFVNYGLPREVFGFGGGGWSGAIPVGDHEAPSYSWRFQRDCAFAYRERLWETDAMSATQGHVHVGALLTIALAGTHFVRRAIEHLGITDNTRFVLRLHLAGMRGRGVVAYAEDAPRSFGILDKPPLVASEDEFCASTATTAGALSSQPREVGVALVQELLRSLRPSTSRPSLERQLAVQREHDGDRSSEYHWLGFLRDDDDDFEKTRRALQIAYQEYRAGLAACAGSTGKAKTDAWKATITKLEEVKTLAEKARVIAEARAKGKGA